MFPQLPSLTDLLVCTLHKFCCVLMQVSSASLNNLSGFKAWLLKPQKNIFEAFIQCKCFLIINYKRGVLVVLTKEQKRTLTNLVMIVHNFVHSMGHSSFRHCIFQFEAKQKEQRLSALPSWCNFWFPDSMKVRGAPGMHLTQHPCRKQQLIAVLQCLAGAVPCRIPGKGLGGLLPIFKIFPSKSSPLASSTTTNWSLKQSSVYESWGWDVLFVCLQSKH